MEKHILSASCCAKCFATSSHLLFTNPSEVSLVPSLWLEDQSSESRPHPPKADRRVRGWDGDPGPSAIALCEQNPGMEISLFMLEFYPIFDGGKRLR